MRTPSPSTRCKSRSGFTLIELLVVVCVIVVLVSILLPALRQARFAVQRVTCLSHLRQLGAAFQTYAIDNDNFLPDTSDANPQPMDNWLRWIPPEPLQTSALYRYVGADFSTVLMCPGEMDRPTYDNYIGYYPSSYSFNSQITQTPGVANYRQLTRIVHPIQTVLLVDDEMPNDSLYYYFVSPSSPCCGGFVSRISLRHDASWNPSVNDDSAITNARRAGHLGNVLFVDFHASPLDVSHENDPAYFDAVPNELDQWYN
jgi:prepilin-type N-terminal cleavage/methylation domain-containing protein